MTEFFSFLLWEICLPLVDVISLEIYCRLQAAMFWFPFPLEHNLLNHEFSENHVN
jgi:hypothetical protein